MQAVREVQSVGNGAAEGIETEMPYTVRVKIRGCADLLFHRWDCDGVEHKSKAAKGSKQKKTDDVESYVWRDKKGGLGLPGEYVRQSVIHAAKFRQDPRSPRKSAMDLFKAGVVCLTNLAPLGKEKWDFEDRRRVTIQRNAITRVRPGIREGWEAEVIFQILLPEYIRPQDLHDTLTMAGKLCGVGDFRPTFGRFQVVEYEVQAA